MLSFRRNSLILALLLLGSPVASQRSSQEAAIAREVAERVRAFVLEHSNLAGSLPMVLSPSSPSIGAERFRNVTPFTSGEIEDLASAFEWEVGSWDAWKDCDRRPGYCLLRDNAILFRLSRPLIDGDRAVVAVAWGHNSYGVTRHNARVLELTPVGGSEWRVTRVLECGHSVGGGPCQMTVP